MAGRLCLYSVLVGCVQCALLEGLESRGLEFLGDHLDHLSQTEFLRNKGFAMSGATDCETLTSIPAANICIRNSSEIQTPLILKLFGS